MAGFSPNASILYSGSTAGTAISPSSGQSMNGWELLNLSTVAFYGMFALSSLTTISTGSTAAAAARGFTLAPGLAGAGPVQYRSDFPFVSLLSTGTGLSGIVSVTRGQFF